MMHFIYGLIDPRTMRVFHVGCTPDPTTELNSLPSTIADRVAEITPAAPQLVILQIVDTHPQVAWVKWSKRFRRDILTNDWEQYEGIAKALSNSNRAKRVLGEEVRADADNQEKFHEFDQQNPEVFEEMLRIARAWKAEGREASSVEVLANDIRWGGADTTHGDGFKFNNNFKAFYVRKLLMEDCSLCGLFTIREGVAADNLVLPDGSTWKDFAREHSGELRFAEPLHTDEEDTEWEY